MVTPNFRNMTHADGPAVVSLNAAVVSVTSPMDLPKFAVLYEFSTFRLVAEVDGEVTGFVLAMASGQPYENGNYRWFSEQVESFLYIDRVVVTESCRGLGIGRSLYSRVYDAAQESGVVNVCAEMDIAPPNTESLRFHKKAGFVQVGTRILGNGKEVSMQVRSVAGDSRNA